MVKESSSNSSGKSGNTKQISPSKHWCFTLNNYKEIDIQVICSNSSIKRYVFQEEIGEKGTPHLQGYLEFITKKRPVSEFKSFKAHWEKCRKVKESIIYCQKADTRSGRIFRRGVVKHRPLKVLSRQDLYTWQEQIVVDCEAEPDDRAINWYWDEEGNIGKSQLVRYLVVHNDAILVSGRSGDIKYQIKQYVDKHGTGPEIVIYDIPRTARNYINYCAIEEVKNGCFASNKYESDMVVINPPHFLCFANFEPSFENMSQDRWKVVDLGETTVEET